MHPWTSSGSAWNKKPLAGVYTRTRKLLRGSCSEVRQHRPLRRGRKTREEKGSTTDLRTNNWNNCGKGSGNAKKAQRTSQSTAAAVGSPPPRQPYPPWLITLIRSFVTGLMKANRVEIAGKQLGLCEPISVITPGTRGRVSFKKNTTQRKKKKPKKKNPRPKVKVTQVHFLKEGGEEKARADRQRAAAEEQGGAVHGADGPPERRGRGERTSLARWSVMSRWQPPPPLSAVLMPPDSNILAFLLCQGALGPSVSPFALPNLARPPSHSSLTLPPPPLGSAARRDAAEDALSPFGSNAQRRLAQSSWAPPRLNSVQGARRLPARLPHAR
ncbi:PREDICTED: uncharacterized protein LOC105594183 [Cercocebus atys]|uniref:uncharacterized protein LOC105594183 n=1 Tax=Cercocebus atys TaxID=9531 RepID=UPI0005F520E5|nr:PREDICTED: uncharacterized protein LOC105594183 [Cercocebus atys]